MNINKWIYTKFGFQLKHGDKEGETSEQTPSPTLILSSENMPIINSPLEEGKKAVVIENMNEIPGFIGRDIEKNQDARQVVFPLLSEDKKHDYLVICFYTSDNEYAEIVKKLRLSLDKFNINHKLVPISSVGHWEQNCAFKAKFIQEQWEQSQVPIVWLDADATVENNPSLFAELDCDFAVRKNEGWEFCSGTLYFGKTDLAKKLIDQWVVRCEADPFNWDQTSLQSAWCDISSVAPLRSCWLPLPYLIIFDAHYETDYHVIKHWQASRQVKKEGRTSGKPQFGYSLTEQGLENRKNDILWRTPEEAFWILEGTRHIKPEIGNEYPEGFDVSAWLRKAIGADYPLLEIGCGVGRIARLFKPDEYMGVDINPTAIQYARIALPDHNLRVIDNGMHYPKAAAVLLYTVLLHVSDEEIQSMIQNVCLNTTTVIIAELMDRRWRRDGTPPVFNRNPEDYILMMQNLGYMLIYADKKSYARYDVEPSNIGKDSRITALVFKSQECLKG